MGQPQFEVLGSLRAWRGEAGLSLGSVQQQVVLAVLLLHANRALHRDQLISAVWGESAPAYAINLLQKHISGLRRLLEPSRSRRAPSRWLAWTEAGYRLAVPGDDLDLDRFDQAVRDARARREAGDLPAAAKQLRTALAMWRGPVCEGLSSPLLDAERDRLEERRIGLLEERIELDLAAGGHHDLVTELRRLVAGHPFRERQRGLLMLALYRSGRTAEALAAFHDGRRLLVGELGIEPTQHLRQLHERILQGDPALSSPTGSLPGPGGEVTPGRVVPAQLPARVPDFTGRRTEVDHLDALPRKGAGRALIAVITGAAGVGKTALAVHWAHRVADLFPDGQLYVNLRGFDARHSPTAPEVAIRGFLDAFGVPAAALPETTAAQAALYRSVLAGRRMLVVLDNARDAEQVRPLLPGAPDCLVVVTSRDQLPGLVAALGARPVLLGPWTEPESREFMSRRLGRDRVAAEPRAVDEIVDRCAGLPLALSIVATRAALRPDFLLGSLANRLRATRDSLDAFAQDDQTTDVRGVLSWSDRALAGPVSAMLRVLSLHPGPDIGPAAAASLAGVPVPDGTAALATLAQIHLIHESTPGRFGMHELVRVYAGEQARDEPPPAREAARSRMFGHYLDTAEAADRLLASHDDLCPPGFEAGTTEPPLAGPAHALAWFTTEQRVLLGLVEQLAADGHHRDAWRLARTLVRYLSRRGHLWDMIGVQELALRSARYLDDPAAQASAHRSIAAGYLKLCRVRDASPHLRHALAFYHKLGDTAGQSRIQLDLAYVNECGGRHASALSHAKRALALSCTADDPVSQADAQNAVGWYHAQLGRYGPAQFHCQHALALHRASGDRDGEAHTWHSLAYVRQRLGKNGPAIAGYRRAIALWQHIGDRYAEAAALVRVGDLHEHLGDVTSARTAWRQAWAVLDGLGHTDAERLRGRLSAPAPTGPAVGGAADPALREPAHTTSDGHGQRRTR